MAHVVTLNATDNQVSRWFSEGVSVLEERRHGPSRRQAVSLRFLEAWQDGRLLPIAELDGGFIRPAYDGQIMVSYVQAGLVCEFVSERYPGGLARMLEAYARGTDTDRAIRDALGVAPGALDDAFEEWLVARFEGVAENLEEFRKLNTGAHRAAAAGDWAAAAADARAAVLLYPDYAAQGSPYPVAVHAARHTGDGESALSLAAAYYRAGGRSPDVLRILAGHPDPALALEARRGLALTVPLDADARRGLGDALLAAGAAAEAAREYQAVLSLAPHDRAGAHYRLAAALNATGAREAARREVLLALEIAPRYSEALSLLIELQQ
jgi:tetratricopeptide (TPR) repeat protein